MEIIIFLPILLLLLIAIVVIFFSQKRFIAISGNWILSLFASYVSILVIAAILFFLIPDESYTPIEAYPTESSSTDSSYEIMEAPLYDAAFEGRIHDIDEKFVKYQKVFPISQSELPIVSSDGDQYLQTIVLIERKSENDGEVEATIYQPPSSLTGIELTEEQKTHQLQLVNGVLEVTRPELVEYQVVKFDNEAVVTQFTKEERMQLNVSTHQIIGNEIIYLQVPKDLIIIGDVQYVQPPLNR